jgi:Icc protein
VVEKGGADGHEAQARERHVYIRVSMRIAQITDCHLVAEAGRRIYGADTFAALRAVLRQALALEQPPELIVATGDLSEDGSEGSYRRLRQLFAESMLPVYVIPGNHDSPTGMADFLIGGSIRAERMVDVGSWRILFLDSKVEGEAYGYLEESELAALSGALSEDARRPTAICLHHSPTKPCPSPDCHLRNEDVFIELLNGHDNAKVVLAGHSHMELKRQIAHATLLTTPATSSQCRHAQAKPAVDHEDFFASHRFDPSMHAFRTLTLRPNGEFDTEVCWVAGE